VTGAVAECGARCSLRFSCAMPHGPFPTHSRPPGMPGRMLAVQSQVVSRHIVSAERGWVVHSVVPNEVSGGGCAFKGVAGI
jgi:hypothetical protein